MLIRLSLYVLYVRKQLFLESEDGSSRRSKWARITISALADNFPHPLPGSSTTTASLLSQISYYFMYTYVLQNLLMLPGHACVAEV
jgi:hypothetical protein